MILRIAHVCAVFVTCALVAACSDEGMSCGDGTKLVDGECVLLDAGPSCGDGTSAADGACVQDEADAAVAIADVPSELKDTQGADAGAGAADAAAGSSASSDDATTPLDAAGGPKDATSTVDLGCDPACDGKTCGPDGCGGSCGTCSGDATCSGQGQCVPKAWTCGAVAFGDGKKCHCGCGAVDPDCKLNPLPVYSDGDPADCVNCDAKGACVKCKPSCKDPVGKAADCGDDGCGGSCGTCTSGKPWCVSGHCSATCQPSCVGKNCGDDGCGGQCGSCPNGQACYGGVCATTLPTDPTPSGG